MLENLETELDNILINHNHNRKIINEPGDSDWGQLIIPAKNENPKKTKKGLKLLLMSSYKLGYLLIDALIKFEEKYPDKLNIIGLITDDPVSPHARISMKRRIWRLFDKEENLDIEDATLELALSAGIPCFTGAVKTTYARKLLHHWNPDAIQVCVFGQIIDEPFINAPKYGIYNFHPADLAHHLGAGPQPFQDLINRDAATSLFTIHHLTADLDEGPVVGQSPLINVRFEDGTISNKLLVLEDKMTEPLDFMAILLTKELILNKEKQTNGGINKIDFSKFFTVEQKQKLLQSVLSDIPMEEMLEVSEYTLRLLDKLWENLD
jgi:folate-dependent phosphoribosylglycinamide formyltransferase PurN